MTNSKTPAQSKFSTKTITSIVDRNDRIKTHFISLRKMECVIINDPEIIHRKIAVELDNGKMFLMNFSALYINMVLWLFNVTYNEPITEDDIHDFTDINKGVYQKVMDKIISKFLKLGHDLDSFNIIGTIKEKIIKMSRFYGEVISNTFSLFDIMAFESRSPEFSEIFNTPLKPEMMTNNEIERYLEIAKNRVYDLIINDRQSSLYPYISTNIVNQLQMGQMFVAVGARFDIDKSILPKVIEQGWMHGMKSPSDFFVEAVQTRNAIIVKKESVPDSGYISRKVNIACLNTHTDSRIYDCGTKHYLSYYVADEKHLRLIEGKYMVVDESIPLLKEISVTDKELIGTTIRFRSHTKCITGHKVNKVCCCCLGNKHTSLSNARIGGLVSIKIINPITQLGLSAKHGSGTKSEDVSGDIFSRYFTVSKSSIFPRKDVCATRRCQLLIPLDIANDILSADSVVEGEIEEGLDFAKGVDHVLIVENGVLRGLDLEEKSFFLNMSDSLISTISNGTGDIVRGDDIINSIAYLESSNETLWDNELQDAEFIALNFADLDPTESTFNIKLLTEEVSKYLRMTRAIIDGSKTTTYTRPEDAIIDLVDVIFKAGTRSDGMMIHIETLMMNLIRSKNDKIVRADYSSNIEPEIQMIKLSQAIQKSDLFSGIVFEDLRRQFELADILKKCTPGIFDIFFKNTEFGKNGVEFRKTRPYLFNRVAEEPDDVIVAAVKPKKVAPVFGRKNQYRGKREASTLV